MIRSLFVSHGAPTFALEPGLAGPALTGLGASLPRPQAVLVVSPHWQAPGPVVMTTPAPATLHDFGGFPEALYRLRYAAPGHPALAQAALALLADAGWAAGADPQRPLDHGAWVPLGYLFPNADVPVFQVALPDPLDARGAWELGQALAPLREQGVLIVGSGSLTHNLRDVRWHAAEAAGYAGAFAGWVREAVTAGASERLLRTLDDAPHARRAHPTTEHFLPLLVAAGAAGHACPADWIDGGTEHGALVMDAYVFRDPSA